MRGMRLSALVWLAVLIAAYLGTTPVFAGEHPWDNDNGHTGVSGGSLNPGTGGGTPGTTGSAILTPTDSTGRVIQTTTTCELNGTWTLMFRVTSWVLVNWTGVKGSVANDRAHMGKTSRLVK
jgi:hypothetical protein